MTQQEYIETYAPRYAKEGVRCTANNICKEIQNLCNCTTSEAVKTLITTFAKALEMRDKVNCN